MSEPPQSPYVCRVSIESNRYENIITAPKMSKICHGSMSPLQEDQRTAGVLGPMIVRAVCGFGPITIGQKWGKSGAQDYKGQE